jgi:hypothetical protein
LKSGDDDLGPIAVGDDVLVNGHGFVALLNRERTTSAPRKTKAQRPWLPSQP